MSKYKKVYAVIDNYHENRNPILGRLYIMLNYWRFIKAGYYWIFTYKVYYIAFPRIYRKAENE